MAFAFLRLATIAAFSVTIFVSQPAFAACFVLESGKSCCINPNGSQTPAGCDTKSKSSAKSPQKTIICGGHGVCAKGKSRDLKTCACS
jgi:hypothetical protein